MWIILDFSFYLMISDYLLVTFTVYTSIFNVTANSLNRDTAVYCNIFKTQIGVIFYSTWLHFCVQR